MEKLNGTNKEQVKDFGRHASELIEDNLETDKGVDLESLENKKNELEKKLSEVNDLVINKSNQIKELLDNKGDYEEIRIRVLELKNKYQVIEDYQRQLATVIAIIKIKKKEL
jgi:precorrin-6B methylase 2